MEAVLATPKEQLLARLDDPDVVDTLNRLLDQLPLLTFGAEAVSELLKRGDTITDNISSGLSELRQTQIFPETQNGEQTFFETLSGNLPGLMKTGARLADTATKPAVNNLLSQGLIEEIGRPETIDLIKRLLDKLELIVFTVEAADGFIRRSDAIIENIGASVRDAAQLLPDQATLRHLQEFATSAPHLLEAASSLIDSGTVEKLQQLSEASDRLIASGLLEPARMKMVADMGSTLSESLQFAQEQAARGRSPRVGLFGLLGALRDPNVQASMGLLVDFSKRYGAKLAASRGSPGA